MLIAKWGIPLPNPMPNKLPTCQTILFKHVQSRFEKSSQHFIEQNQGALRAQKISQAEQKPLLEDMFMS